MFQFGFQQRSGRVIALGRSMLAALFLLAIWLDATQPAQAVGATYGVLAAYVLISLAIAGLTWNDWWLDAKLAAPAHILDVGVFTVLVFFTEGYTSPFFLFFVFLLLSAAIRWGWRETAMTAAAVIILYLGAGLGVGASQEEFELQRFIIRSGHLVILSAILIWFGASQRFSLSVAPAEDIPPASLDESPLETGLLTAAGAAAAPVGLLLWREAGSSKCVALRYRNGALKIADAAPELLHAGAGERPFLYDLARNRALARKPTRRHLFARASDWIDVAAAGEFQLSEGLAVPLRVDTGRGLLFLEGMDGLSTDHVELAAQLSRDIADHIRRHALLKAVEEGGESRARLSLARDLHDSVVQFLAGAAFRIEAMMRQSKTGGQISPDLKELKRLMLEEQADLRSFIGALRSGHEIGLPQLAEELQSLGMKLGRQWDIDCSVSAQVPQRMIPMRLHLDAQQLVREAVANAVRHGNATAVRIYLALDEDRIRLDFQDNGGGFPAAMTLSAGSDELHPRSLKERVADAGGELALATLAHGTSLTITLPVAGRP